LTGKVIGSSPQELQLQYSEDSFLFVYRFGCLVFFNVDSATVQRETEKLKAALGGVLAQPTTETYNVRIADTTPQVEFEFVTFKKLNLDNLRLVCMTLGQSAALEYFEIQADRLLHNTHSFLQNLSRSGSLPFNSRRLLKVIGMAAGAKQNILSNLAILDPPDEAWKSKELERLFKDLQGNYDIEIRFRTLDRKLSVLQDNLEIIADLSSTRQSKMLEISIVCLILFEIIMAFVKH